MKKFYLIQSPEVEPQTGGSSAASTKAPPPTTTPKQETTASNEESGDDFDELGYAKAGATKEPPKEAEKKQAADTKTETKVPGDGKKANEDAKTTSATGYGKSSLEEDGKTEDKTPSPPEKLSVTDEATKEVFELKTEGLSSEETAKLKTFIDKNKLSKTQAQDLIDLKKAELKSQSEAQIQAKKDQELAVKKVKQGWEKELRSDPTFGGANFDKNNAAVDKLLLEQMPETRKVLTERGSMLPPYVMRDLAKLAEHLYSPNDSLVQGSATVSEKLSDTEESDDPLDFYKAKQS